MLHKNIDRMTGCGDDDDGDDDDDDDGGSGDDDDDDDEDAGGGGGDDDDHDVHGVHDPAFADLEKKQSMRPDTHYLQVMLSVRILHSCRSLSDIQ